MCALLLLEPGKRVPHWESRLLSSRLEGVEQSQVKTPQSFPNYFEVAFFLNSLFTWLLHTFDCFPEFRQRWPEQFLFNLSVFLWRGRELIAAYPTILLAVYFILRRKTEQEKNMGEGSPSQKTQWLLAQLTCSNVLRPNYGHIIL